MSTNANEVTNFEQLMESTLKNESNMSNKNNENSLKIQQKFKNYSILSDRNNNYNITIQYHLNSEINIIAINDYDQKKFSNNFTLNELKYYKYLSLLDTLDEIYDELIDKIEKKPPKIIEKNNSLKLSIDTGHTKFKEINIYLNQKEKSIIEKYNELYSIVNELQEKEKIQDEKIKILTEEIQQLKNNNLELYEKNKILENSIESLKEIFNFNINDNSGYEYKNNNYNSINLPFGSTPYIPKSKRENKENEGTTKFEKKNESYIDEDDKFEKIDIDGLDDDEDDDKKYDDFDG